MPKTTCPAPTPAATRSAPHHQRRPAVHRHPRPDPALLRLRRPESPHTRRSPPLHRPRPAPLKRRLPPRQHPPRPPLQRCLRLRCRPSGLTGKDPGPRARCSADKRSTSPHLWSLGRPGAAPAAALPIPVRRPRLSRRVPVARADMACAGEARCPVSGGSTAGPLSLFRGRITRSVWAPALAGLARPTRRAAGMRRPDPHALLYRARHRRPGGGLSPWVCSRRPASAAASRRIALW